MTRIERIDADLFGFIRDDRRSSASSAFYGYILYRSVASVVGLVALLGLWWAVAEGPLRNPGDALEDFYEAKDSAEDQLMGAKADSRV